MKAKRAAAAVLNPVHVVSLEHKRDAYGFAVRPQHVQRYREYANIYKEEEEERSDRWKDFLERQSESAQLPVNGLVETDNPIKLNNEPTNRTSDGQNNVADSDCSVGNKTEPNNLNEEKPKVPSVKDGKVHRIQTWTEIRPSLRAIENLMSSCVKKKVSLNNSEPDFDSGKQLHPIYETKPGKGAFEEDSDEEFYDVERSESDTVQDIPPGDGIPASSVGPADHAAHTEVQPPPQEELECLVQGGGVPMSVRGEV